jgi:hypothetical protein
MLAVSDRQLARRVWAAVSALHGALLVCAVLLSVEAMFVVKHGRLPVGSGEMWNWLLGLML